MYQSKSESKTILSVRTFIKDKRQYVLLTLGDLYETAEDPQRVQLTMNAALKAFPQKRYKEEQESDPELMTHVEQLIGEPTIDYINVARVEYLTGMNFVFHTFIYEKGDKLPNGEVADSQKEIQKFSILPDKDRTVSSYVKENRQICRDFRLITKAKYFPATENKRECIQISSGDDKRYIQVTRFLAITGLGSINEYHLLEGNYMTFETWNEGDVIQEFENDKPFYVMKNRSILKNPEVRSYTDIAIEHNLFSERMNKEKQKLNSYNSFNEYRRRSSYEQYGGPSDGYGGYLSDDFINDVLGGEPDAIWNID